MHRHFVSAHKAIVVRIYLYGIYRGGAQETGEGGGREPPAARKRLFLDRLFKWGSNPFGPQDTPKRRPPRQVRGVPLRGPYRVWHMVKGARDLDME